MLEVSRAGFYHWRQRPPSQRQQEDERLKNELVHHHRFKTRAEAKAAIQEYIEIFYNRQRRHSRLGNVSSAEFTKRYWRTAQAT
ncbi:hypothetical protein AERO9A_140369 [Aeromonas salmonicida]|nr:hypothetical protein AERO9A_140369 [Aeromonas salmonicida]